VNDKIKLFNEQSIKYAQTQLNDIAIVNKSGIMYNYNDLYTEKFAELIIRESIRVMVKNDYHGGWLGEKVKEHFGVER